MVGVHEGQQRTSLCLGLHALVACRTTPRRRYVPPKNFVSCFVFASDLDLAIAISRVKHCFVHCFPPSSLRACATIHSVRSCVSGERPHPGPPSEESALVLYTHGVLNGLTVGAGMTTDQIGSGWIFSRVRGCEAAIYPITWVEVNRSSEEVTRTRPTHRKCCQHLSF